MFKKILFSIILICSNICYGADSYYVSHQVLIFAQSKVGQTVGNGNSWIFTRDAMLFASARFPGPRGSLPNNTFGRQILINEVGPGDVIYFRYAKFAKNGKVYARTPIEHYAIVESTNNGQIQVIQQNWMNSKKVSRGSFNPFDFVSGKMVFYRPQR